MTKDLLTASRMACMLACPRRHYYRYEAGLRKVAESDALRFGSAWHLAMECRWRGATPDEALTGALAGHITLDELQVATLAGMLAGYYQTWQVDPVQSVHPEVEFRHPIEGSRTFDAAGKIDGLAVMRDGRLALVEHKTAGFDIAPDSDYWLRLRGNVQVLQYVLAARALGWDVAMVLYDVARKPMIQPMAAVPVLDENGAKVVVDAAGARVFKKDGTPRESADKEKGYTVQARPETNEEFCARLANDTQLRPDFYFARREMPVLDDDLAEFQVQRLVIGRSILTCRAETRAARYPEHGWPRNVGEMTCRNCEFAPFCLQNTRIDPAMPPAGFTTGGANSELTTTAG